MSSTHASAICKARSTIKLPSVSKYQKRCVIAYSFMVRSSETTREPILISTSLNTCLCILPSHQAHQILLEFEHWLQAESCKHKKLNMITSKRTCHFYSSRKLKGQEPLPKLRFANTRYPACIYEQKNKKTNIS